MIRKEFYIQDKKFHIVFFAPTGEFLRTLEIVKTIPGCTFNIKTKEWECPANESNKGILLRYGFDTHDSDTTLTQVIPPIIPHTLESYEHQLLDSRLFKYQKQGVTFLEQNKGICLLADDMGVGKSCQVISYCSIHPEKRPVLVVCPATLKINWEREIQMWDHSGKLNTYIANGTTPDPNIKYKHYDYVVINYDILKKWEQVLYNIPFKLIIGDEIQAIANTTQRTHAFRFLAQKIPEKIFLSGTPIKNRPAEFYNALSLLRPKLFSNKSKFLKRYCEPLFNRWTQKYDYRGATNIEELAALIHPFVLRRLKKDVLQDLPEKRRITVPLDMTSTGLTNYHAAHEEFVQWAEKNQKSSIEGRKHIETLKQLAYLGKRDYAIQWIRDFLETSDEKIIIFIWHKGVMKDLKNIFTDAVCVDGSTSRIDKQNAIDKFQHDKNTRIFIGNILAAGTGITLTAASTVIFLELGWTPSDHLQCEDRALRIGQKNTVYCYYLVSVNTVEERIVKMINDKSLVLNNLFDNSSSTFFSEEFMDYLTTGAHNGH